MIIASYIKNLAPKSGWTDHRAAVGGLWNTIGLLQLYFMIAQGLLPQHKLLDIGCGSLRAGRLFIDYLDSGNYMGIDADERLVREGMAKEVGATSKHPQFAFNDSFDFHFDQQPDFALAQSLFTHLTREQIALCLANLKNFAPHCRCYATFFETPIRLPQPFKPHPQRNFFYTRTQLAHIAERTGWRMQYIGEWGHPRYQVMAVYQ